jgi:hypothetical protein
MAREQFAGAQFIEQEVRFAPGGVAQATPAFSFIDISDKPLKSTVVRDGKEVPFVQLNQAVVEQFVGSAVSVSAEVPRVVSQSVPAGAKVPRGASVNLVLAPRNKIPVGVFAGGHPAFAALAGVRNVDDLVTTFLTATVANAVLDFDAPDKVPEATRTVIANELLAKGVTIDPNDKARDFAAAFNTLKGAAVFGK